MTFAVAGLIGSGLSQGLNVGVYKKIGDYYTLGALAKDLGPYQAAIADMRLVDFKVRITQGGTEAAMLVDVSGVDSIGMTAWSITSLLPAVAVIVVAALAAMPRLYRVWKNSSLEEKFGATLLSSYFIAGVSMVILARTLYQWGEPRANGQCE